jgi:hypothetical protein
MKARFKVLSIVAVAILLLFVVPAREKLTEWRLRKVLEQIDKVAFLNGAFPEFSTLDPSQPVPDQDHQVRAVKALGASAIPVLKEWLELENETGLQARLYHNQLFQKLFKPRHAYRDRELAILGCWVLGADAKPLVPTIASLTQPGSEHMLESLEFDLGSALACIGTNALPEIMSLLNNEQSWVARSVACEALTLMPHRITKAAPQLTACWERTGDLRLIIPMALHLPDDQAATFIASNLTHDGSVTSHETARALKVLAARGRTNVVGQLVPQVHVLLCDPNESSFEISWFSRCASRLGHRAGPLVPVLTEIAKTNRHVERDVATIKDAVMLEQLPRGLDENHGMSGAFSHPGVVPQLISYWESTGHHSMMRLIALHMPDDQVVTFLATNLLHASPRIQNSSSFALRYMLEMGRTKPVADLVPQMNLLLGSQKVESETVTNLFEAATRLGHLAGPLVQVLTEIAKTNHNETFTRWASAIKSDVAWRKRALSAANRIKAGDAYLYPTLAFTLWDIERNFLKWDDHSQEWVENNYLNQEESIDLAIRNLGKPDWASKRNAADHLAKLGQPAQRALPALEEVAKDPFPPVREAAMEAVRKIRGDTR